MRCKACDHLLDNKDFAEDPSGELCRECLLAGEQVDNFINE